MAGDRHFLRFPTQRSRIKRGFGARFLSASPIAAPTPATGNGPHGGWRDDSIGLARAKSTAVAGLAGGATTAVLRSQPLRLEQHSRLWITAAVTLPGAAPAALTVRVLLADRREARQASVPAAAPAVVDVPSEQPRRFEC